MPENKSDAAGRPTKAKGALGPRSIRGRLAAGILIIIPLAVTAILIRYVYTVALSIGVKLVNWTHLGYLWATDAEEPVTAGAQAAADAVQTAASQPQATADDALWRVVHDLKETAQILKGEVASSDGIVPLINPADPGWEGITLAVGMTIALLYLLGWLGSNVVGRRVIDIVEGLFQQIPFVDTVYGAMKRMVQALSGVGKDDEKSQRVVLVDFPHEHMKAIAFMTNTLTDLNSGQKMATVYVPTTPNPTSGYMEIVPINRITQTDWTMEEALSMILSGGATAPESVRLAPRPTDD